MSDRISSAPPERLSLDYAALRERGMDWIRQLAGESWSDHNVHDPGVTLLEAFCYAMTELGFRIQQTLPDLLRSGEIYGQSNLAPAHQMLPTAPVTALDLQQVLLDHLLVNDAQIILNTASSVPLYEDEAMVQQGNPSLTYDDTSHPVAIQGLYDVLIFFEDRSWNSNTYTLTVTVGSENTYLLEIALPYWDDPEAEPLRTGVFNTLNEVTMQSFGTTVWRSLDEAQSYFGRLQVTYNGDATLNLWVVLRIIDNLAQPTLETPLILDAAQTALQTVGSDNNRIQQFIQRVQAAQGGAEQLQRYVESWRHLGEVPIRLQVARQQEIGIRARIEVTGSTNLEQLLAAIFITVDAALSPEVSFSSLETMRQQGATPETLYDGPLLRHGFLATTTLETLARLGILYTSDILRLIMQQRSGTGTDLVAQENPTGRDIVAVTDLALSNFVNNRPITTDARDCLTLVDIQRYRPRLSLTKSRITFVRNDLDVPYDLGRVAELIEQLQALPDGSNVQSLDAAWPVSIGEILPIDDYFPVQNDLPRIYGVGENAVPAQAGKLEQARSLQTKGYLLIFEQFLADLTAQLSHINNLFSGAPEERTTYFTRALFDISGTEQLLKGFPREPNDLWENYIADPDNPYQQALQAAAEAPSQFLDRRNRMLDHLLARQGENMVTWAQELHRWAQKDLTASLESLSTASDIILAAIAARRLEVNARLIYHKAKFLAAAPSLNMTKLQAWGQPLQQFPDLLTVVPSMDGVYWLLTVMGQARLRSTTGFMTEADAVIDAESAIELAAQVAFYRVVDAGSGLHRYQLTDTTDNTSISPRLWGESIQTWSTAPAALNAANDAAAAFANLRIATSLTAMERRIGYLTGIRRQQRQPLINSLETYFEIYDEADNDAAIEKRWRLWELPGQTGNVLLSSVFNFEDDDEAQAIAAAQASIQQVIHYGLDEWNYRVSPAGETTFNFELRHPGGAQLGMANTPLPSEAVAFENINRVIDHLYRFYSAEGFHLIEHVLLRPQQGPGEDPGDPGDGFLELPSDLSNSGWERDPYSYRLSLIFPSGYGRDFSPEASDPDVRTPIPPHRFRDREFRNHVERIVQQSCPAHLYPTLYWVDRQDPEQPFEFPVLTAENATDISFDQFEAIYFIWLNTQLLSGISDTEKTTARNQMILAMNALPPTALPT